MILLVRKAQDNSESKGKSKYVGLIPGIGTGRKTH
jgi:hypothetical protein